jgi:hypothetical protein
MTLPISAQLKLTLSPVSLKLTRGCVPRVLKLSPNVSEVLPKVLKLIYIYKIIYIYYEKWTSVRSCQVTAPQHAEGAHQVGDDARHGGLARPGVRG